MFINIKKLRITIVTTFVVAMFFSCKSKFKEDSVISNFENEPIGVAENVNLKYTDSGKVKAILKSPIMLDYSNRSFGFREFPKGVNLELITNGEKNIVISDFATYYIKTNIIDLKGNVLITTPDNDTLYAEQLYYDESKQWLFTNLPVTFRTGQDKINGNGFDSNSDFTNAEVLEITGIITVNE